METVTLRAFIIRLSMRRDNVGAIIIRAVFIHRAVIFVLCVVHAIAVARLTLEGGTNVHQASQTSPRTLNLTETNVQFIELRSYGSRVFPMRGGRRRFYG